MREHGPIHRSHAVTDLNQSGTRNAAIFSAGFCLTRWYHKQRLGTHRLSAVLSFLVQSPQQNGCMGAYTVIDLEQFPVRISTDKADTTNKIWDLFFLFVSSSVTPFFFSLFSFLLPLYRASACQIHGVSVPFSWDDPCLHNNNKW